MDNFRSYLPSGRFVVTAAAVLIVAGLIFAAEKFPTETSIEYGDKGGELAVGERVNLIDLPSDTDTDSDGLKDWEENLWGTDPKKKDTDGDKTLDGEEIAKGRDPRKAGPKDTLSASAKLGISPTKRPEELSSTDIFAREFFSEYARLKSMGIPMSSSTERTIIGKVLTSENVVKPARSYTEGEISVLGDSSPAALKKYGNDMGLILKTDPYVGGEDEVTILNRAIEKNNEDEVRNIDPIIASYEIMLKQMLSVSVPKSAVSIHLQMLNAISAQIHSTKQMRNVFVDPVPAMVALGAYKETQQKIVFAFQNAQIFFKSQGITYTKNENGVYFVGTLQ